MRRLLEIQMMLFSTREAVKEGMLMLGDGGSSSGEASGKEAAAAGGGGGGNGGGGGGSIRDKPRDMKSVLCKLERQVSSIMREESASDRTGASKKSS
jgi:hypothetical protein